MEELRKHLDEIINIFGIDSKEVLEVSRELDVLIVNRQRYIKEVYYKRRGDAK